MLDAVPFPCCLTLPSCASLTLVCWGLSLPKLQYFLFLNFKTFVDFQGNYKRVREGMQHVGLTQNHYDSVTVCSYVLSSSSRFSGALMHHLPPNHQIFKLTLLFFCHSGHLSALI